MMKKRKILSAALAAMLAASAPLTGAVNNALSVTASAEETEIKTEGDWDYKVNEDGETVTLVDYNGSDSEVVIPSTLGGKSVTEIGYLAFVHCKSTSITIPNSVTTIGRQAFDYCTSLTNVTIPDSVTSIGFAAFARCEALESVKISAGMTTITERAFYECNSLTNVMIPNSVTTIDKMAFEECTSLSSIKIPDSVTTIADYAFKDCDSLTSIAIPNSVTTIKDGAFYFCNLLTSVAISDSVTEIGDMAFMGCRALETITVGKNNMNYSSIDGVLFNNEKSELIKYPEGKKDKSYTIPDSVTTIESKAFYNCTSLTSITIPDRMTTIDELAFDTCHSLTSITIPDSVTTIGYGAFFLCFSLETVNYGGTKAEWEEIEIGPRNDYFIDINQDNTRFDFGLGIAEIVCTDGIINEREPETSEPTSSDTSEPTESTLTPGGSDNNTTTTEPTVFKPVLDSSTESLDKDSKTVLSGITVTDSKGAFEDGVVMNVKFTGKTANTFSFDITFTKDGKEVQPNGEVTVKVPVPEFLKNGDIYVYHYDENGKATLVPSKVENDFVIFDADHFSKFELSNKKIETESGNSGSDQANTGIALAIAPIALAASIVIVASKKKK